MANLNTKQMIAAAVIAAGGMKKDAAERAGVKAQTVSLWMQSETFRAEIEKFRMTVIYSTRDNLRSLGTKAIETVAELLISGNDSTRLSAAKLVIDTINLTPGANGQEMGLWDTSCRQDTSPFLPTMEDINSVTDES